MRRHELKTWPSSFQAVVDGVKYHEVRRNDRDFAVGDRLLLREWDPTGVGCTTGRALLVEVTFITHGGTFGLPVGTCVMSIQLLQSET